MDSSESTSEKTFKLMLERYPTTVKVLRAYERYLRDVKNDPWKAEKYRAEADVHEAVSPAGRIVQAAVQLSAHVPWQCVSLQSAALLHSPNHPHHHSWPLRQQPLQLSFVRPLTVPRPRAGPG